jgi:hypothetical protein
VRGQEGAPPYRVRFSDGHEGLVYPGPDSLVEPRTPESPRIKDSTSAR